MSFVISKRVLYHLTNVTGKFPLCRQWNSKKLFATNVYHKEPSLTTVEQRHQNKRPEKLQVTKILKIAVVGVPNAGKSTFINNLINRRVCPVSTKVHTTRNASQAIYTTNNTQLILFDTPGLVAEHEIKKHHLESSFNSAYKHSIQRGNIICVIHDISNTWQRRKLHSTVLNTLQSYATFPSFLILNKIDCLKSKRILLDLVKNLTSDSLSGKKILKKSEVDLKQKYNEDGWSNFSDVFMVSSITGDGLQDVLQFLLKRAHAGNWEFHAHTYTDQTPENLIVTSVQARLLDYLPQEIPYTLKTVIEYYSEYNGVIYTSAHVTCPSSRIEKLVCGEMNGKLRQITERITSDLVETFGKPISLTLSTSVAKKVGTVK